MVHCAKVGREHDLDVPGKEERAFSIGLHFEVNQVYQHVSFFGFGDLAYERPVRRWHVSEIIEKVILVYTGSFCLVRIYFLKS